ncbi:hypothetical protein PgNI_10523 [Pyricularia grisea]|uniref:Extracellular serine-rich protein n=1 Tax=Pyricularia grisea TaxID=148305 RepID=A0A6P8AYL9_PYRGI|nr:hypothetical protein PgNI_10523 [Pyricularia grisea]TLD07437.1 hypothetical protein PgNI_10523 [Pyricularia grisea]
MATNQCHPRRTIPQLTAGGFVLFWLAHACMADRLHDGGGTLLTSPAIGVRRAIQSVITVGKNGREFVPNITTGWRGDVIEFHFYPGNYSVVRSAYMFPCVPFENTGTGRQGFWSGFIDNKSPSPAKWRLTLPDSNAIFFYSSAGDDCNRYAMVGGINVMEDQLQMQRDMALDSPSVVQPIAASHPTIDNVPSTSASSDPQAAQPEMPIAVIVGAVLGGVAFLAIIGAILYLCGSRSRKQTESQPAQGGSRSPMMHATRDGSGTGHGSGGSSSAGKASVAGSGHRQHQHNNRIARTSSSIYLPTRVGDGTVDGARGEDVQDYEKQNNGPERWQLEDGQIIIFSNSHRHHLNSHSLPLRNPPLQQPRNAAAVSAPPIIDGDTIYVPVHRSTIMSAKYGGPSPSHYTPPRSPPPNSPVSMAAQMLHRRWLAQEQIDASDAESGVFGIGVRRFPSTTASEDPNSSADPTVPGSIIAGGATSHQGIETAASAPQSPLPPLPGVAEARVGEEGLGVEHHVAAAEIPVSGPPDHHGKLGGVSQQPPSTGAMAISVDGDVSSLRCRGDGELKKPP